MFDGMRSIESDAARSAASCCLATGKVGIDIYTDPNWLILKWVFINQSRLAGQVPSQSFELLVGALVRNSQLFAKRFCIISNVWTVLS